MRSNTETEFRSTYADRQLSPYFFSSARCPCERSCHRYLLDIAHHYDEKRQNESVRVDTSHAIYITTQTDCRHISQSGQCRYGQGSTPKGPPIGRPYCARLLRRVLGICNLGRIMGAGEPKNVRGQSDSWIAFQRKNGGQIHRTLPRHQINGHITARRRIS